MNLEEAHHEFIGEVCEHLNRRLDGEADYCLPHKMRYVSDSGHIASRTPRGVVNYIVNMIRMMEDVVVFEYDPSARACSDAELRDYLPEKFENGESCTFGRFDALDGLRLAIIDGEIDPEKVRIEYEGEQFEIDKKGQLEFSKFPQHGMRIREDLLEKKAALLKNCNHNDTTETEIPTEDGSLVRCNDCGRSWEKKE